MCGHWVTEQPYQDGPPYLVCAACTGCVCGGCLDLDHFHAPGFNGYCPDCHTHATQEGDVR